MQPRVSSAEHLHAWWRLTLPVQVRVTIHNSAAQHSTAQSRHSHATPQHITSHPPSHSPPTAPPTPLPNPLPSQVSKRRSLPEYLYRRCFRLLDLDDSGHLARADILHFIYAFRRSWQSAEDAKALERYFRKKCDKYEFITEEKFLKYCNRTFPIWRTRRPFCGLFF